MQLWRIDIVGSSRLVDERTGQTRDAKLATAWTSHTRFCGMAAAAGRTTGRAGGRNRLAKVAGRHPRRAIRAITAERCYGPVAPSARVELVEFPSASGSSRRK